MITRSQFLLFFNGILLLLLFARLLHFTDLEEGRKFGREWSAMVAEHLPLQKIAIQKIKEKIQSHYHQHLTLESTDKIFDYLYEVINFWPLLTFFSLLVVTFYFLSLSSLEWPALLCFAWLWLVPQFTLNLVFVAHSEQAATLFALLSFILIGTEKEWTSLFKRKRFPELRFLFAGQWLGLAILIRPVTAFFFTAIFLFIFYDLCQFRKFKGKRIQGENKSPTLRKWSFYFLGSFMVFLGFYCLKFLMFIQNFTITFDHFNGDIFVQFFWKEFHLIHSALSAPQWSGSFFLQKLNLWSEVGLDHSLLFWALLACSIVSLPFFYFQWPRLIIGSSAAATAQLCWFILFSNEGHLLSTWSAAYISLILVCMFVGTLIHKIWNLKFSFRFSKIHWFINRFSLVLLLFILIPTLIDKNKLNWNLNWKIQTSPQFNKTLTIHDSIKKER